MPHFLFLFFSLNFVSTTNRWQETAGLLTTAAAEQEKLRRVRDAQERIVLGEQPLEVYQRLEPEVRAAVGEVDLPGDLEYEFDTAYVLRTLENVEKELGQPDKSDLVQQKKLQKYVNIFGIFVVVVITLKC